MHAHLYTYIFLSFLQETRSIGRLFQTLEITIGRLHLWLLFSFSKDRDPKSVWLERQVWDVKHLELQNDQVVESNIIQSKLLRIWCDSIALVTSLEQYWQATDQWCFQCCFCAFFSSGLWFSFPSALPLPLFWRNPMESIQPRAHYFGKVGRPCITHPGWKKSPSPDKDLRLWSGPFRRYLLPPMPRYLFQNCLFHSKHASFGDSTKTLYSDLQYGKLKNKKKLQAATYDDFWVVGHVKVPELELKHKIL